MRYPKFIHPGDGIKFIAPSFGAATYPYDVRVKWSKWFFEGMGYNVVIGENVYYSVYTSQIVESLEKNGIYTMKEGDIFSASVKNTNKTMSQTIRGVFYSIAGSDVYSIAAQHSGVCTANGSY